MKNTKQAIALASAAALSVGMLAGCGGAPSAPTLPDDIRVQQALDASISSAGTMV